MKRFLFKLGLFLATGFVVVNVAAAIGGALSRSTYERDGSETFAAVRLARAPSSSANIILGDSVCHQLLMDSNLPDTLNLSCNQAISMCGQFLLARAAVEHNPNVKRITLAYLPESFTNNLDEKFTFNYVVKPFYVHADMRSGMDERTLKALDWCPWYRLMVLPMFRYSDMLNFTNYAEWAPPSDDDFISPISDDYLHRLAKLCSERQIQLRVISPPINNARWFNAPGFSGKVAEDGLESVFAGYVQSIRDVPPDVLIDGVHFKPQYIRANATPFVEMLQQ